MEYFTAYLWRSAMASRYRRHGFHIPVPDKKIDAIPVWNYAMPE